MKKANLGLVKTINYNLIWDYFLKNNLSTIPTISEKIGLSLPTVTRAIDFAVEIGMVNVDEIADSTGGRKARQYSLNPQYTHFLLLILDNEKLHFEIRDFVGKVVKKGETQVKYDNILEDFERVISELKSEYNKISSVSISIGGVIDNGVILDCYKLRHLNGFNLKRHLENLFKIDVIVENNLKALAKSSQKYDDDYKEKIIISSAFGHSGYGFGFLINGNVLRGSKAAAGEITYAPAPKSLINQPQDYYEFRLQTVITVFNPDTIILYCGDKAIDFRKAITDVSAFLPSYMMPKFIVAKSFTRDSFDGLNELCIELVKNKIYNK
ncbi:MAG: ROK family protein [Oscillospiraceae bacterium]